MAAEPLVLGLDVGTSRIKSLLLDREGQGRGDSSRPTPFTEGERGTEMSVNALGQALESVLQDLGANRERVVGIGIAGVAESGAPLDADGQSLAPIIAWHDPRGAETVARLEATFGDALPNLIGQRLRPVSSVAKLGWLHDHGVGHVHRWLGVPELCLHRLTGAEATEHSLAVRTGCYDVAAKRYRAEVAHTAGFSIEVFPPVVPAGHAMGQVTGSAAAWSGVAPGVPVTLAGHDHLAGADGCGARDDDLVNSVGTAETVIGRSARLPDIGKALDARAAVTLQPGGDGWAVLTSAARAGIVLERLARRLGHSPEELDIRSGQESGAYSDHFPDQKLVQQLLDGEEPSFPAAPAGAVWNGVLAALAERTRDAFDRTVGLVGLPRRLVVFGGGSRSRPWLQAKAEALPVAVWRSGVSEAVARGAALRAGMAAGWWRSPDDAPPAPVEPVS
ncbi:MAG: FGGY family carbohydrate kinase, partial [Actinomycetota bacterium]|nr:FGGY family carbohydrate kinase [Actinomycetota bacterium]